MKKLVRTFHPVGHGAFYSEKFDIGGKPFNIVYDCGGHTINMVNACIERVFKKDEQIDAVFISHLDRDHINGLELLFKHCIVKRIFMPIITDDDLAATVLHNNFTAFAYEFINNTYGKDVYTDEANDIIIKITKISTDGGNKADIDIRELEDNNVIKINSGTNLILDDVWKFKPYNPVRFNSTEGVKLKADIFDEKDLAHLNDGDGNFDMRKLFNEMKVAKSRDLIKKAYAKVKGGTKHNCYSMTLFSGPKSSEVLKMSISGRYRHLDLRNIQVTNLINCMYMGDIELKDSESKNYDEIKFPESMTKWGAFSTAYKGEYKSVGVVQIPHHGSINNYNPNIINSNMLAILSVQNPNTHNSHLHPNPKVKKFISDAGSKSIIVNANKCTKVELTYHF